MGIIFSILAQLVGLYWFILLARILMSWIPNMDPYHPIAQLIYRATEPVLAPARQIIPPIGMVDISPIVVFFALGFIQNMLQGMAR